MNDYIFLMHGDAPPKEEPGSGDDWGPYLASLKAAGHFQGGSAIGTGVCVNRAGTRVELSSHLVGFITIVAQSLAQARQLLSGNPVFEAGGTVEIRELPRT